MKMTFRLAVECGGLAFMLEAASENELTAKARLLGYERIEDRGRVGYMPAIGRACRILREGR